MPYHRNPKPGDKERKCISISEDAYKEIDFQALKHNLTKVKMIDVMVKFFINNYIIVEQLSLSSNNRRIV